jgi:hypothetical protein
MPIINGVEVSEALVVKALNYLLTSIEDLKSKPIGLAATSRLDDIQYIVRKMLNDK